MDDEDIWQENPQFVRDAEWDKLSSGFTNAGYREGITAGKESALQAGFDEGFAQVGAPIGRQLGILRGIASALLSFLQASPATPEKAVIVDEVRAIVSQLGSIRFPDIAPPDLEAVRHAREHLGDRRLEEADEAEMPVPEEVQEKRSIESLEDMLAQMGGGAAETAKRPTMDDVSKLQARLLAICTQLGLSLQWS
ncbi:uncharacterized protein B0H18DRAFT_1113669 [Fomitopsis serialis]|uniref:uncharacterized protein n=1 Tax=Fomitopsis serialis TaxID=139415 RepID=UPI002007BF5E|nr:uncharacterized protein B0H18DRAFT_1113669 [Neoantrodia serialis]KAH9936248.1 hypothetical protein B0H18DRAFT_1113669 [Neoantrodia serialis]